LASKIVKKLAKYYVEVLKNYLRTLFGENQKKIFIFAAKNFKNDLFILI